MATFYSVQSAEDAARLAGGGEPWPSGLRRANIGAGFYAWESRETAEQYRAVLERHGATDLRIVTYEIADDALRGLNTLDLTRLSDEDVTAWLEKHSHYGDAAPHGFEHVIRSTHVGAEHFFAAEVFPMLKEVV